MNRGKLHPQPGKVTSSLLRDWRAEHIDGDDPTLDLDENGLWDPEAKRRKVVRAKPKERFPKGERTAVRLRNLSREELNGLSGYVLGPPDSVTGRVAVIMEDGSEKRVKEENVIEVLTGAIVRIHGLQNAKELNGLIAQVMSLAEDRYHVLVEKTGETKKIRECNLELLKRYSTNRVEELPDSRPWDERMALFEKMNIPIPLVLSAHDLAYEKYEPVSGRSLPVSPAVSSDSGIDVEYCRFQPSLSRNQFRLVCVSGARDTCCGVVDLKVLVRLAQQLVLLWKDMPIYFLIPHLCVKKLPVLRICVERHWPLYLQACSELIRLDSAEAPNKAWCRLETGFFQKVCKPIYHLPEGWDSASFEPGEWLWSSVETRYVLEPPEEGEIDSEEARNLITEFRQFGDKWGEEVVDYVL